MLCLASQARIPNLLVLFELHLPADPWTLAYPSCCPSTGKAFRQNTSVFKVFKVKFGPFKFAVMVHGVSCEGLVTH